MIRHGRRSPFRVLLVLLSGSMLAYGCASKTTPTESETGSITVSVSPASASVQQGSSTDVDVTVTGAGGFTGAATISIQNAPSGVSGAVSNVQSSGGTTTGTVTIDAGAAVAPGTYSLSIRATGAGVSPATATFSLIVTAAPSYVLSATPNQLIIERLGDGSTDIGIARTNFTGDVTLAVEGAPSGVTTSFDQNPVSGDLSTLTLAADATAALATFTVTIRGTAAGLADETTTVEVMVTAPATPDYLLGVTPASRTISQGGSAAADVALTRSNFAEAVTLSAEGMPAGVTVTFVPNPVSGDVTSMTVAVAGSVAVGQYAVTIRGTATGLADKTVAFTLTVEDTPAYSITLAPTSITLDQGASGTIDVSLTRTNFAESVDLSLEGAPTGVTGTFSVDPVSGDASVLTLDVGGSVAAGDYILTVRGTSSLPDETAEMTLTVAEPSGFSLASITAVTVQQGSSGIRTVTINRTGGFTGDVTVTVTDLPAGITASVAPVTTSGTSVDVTVNVAGSVSAGAYTGTVRGNATGLPESAQTLTINVTASSGQQITLDFSQCTAAEKPVWGAYRDGNGPWIPMTGANDVYAFSVAASTFAVAAATTPNTGQSNVFVQHATPAEAALLAGDDLCDPAPSGKTVNASVAGINTLEGESAVVSLGDATVPFLFANGAFQLTNVPDGNLHLVGYKAHPAGTSDRMIIMRDLNPTDGGNIGLIDFASGFIPSAATITPQGGTGSDLWYSEYATSPSPGVCYYAPLQQGLVASGTPFIIRGTSAPQASEYHVVTLRSGFNTVSETFATLAPRTISFGAALPAPTITELSGSYRRVQADLLLPAEYNDFAGVFLVDQAGDHSIQAFASPGWLGGLNVSITIPDLSGVAGWDPGWGPTNAATTDWGFTANGWSGNDCTEGAREVTTIAVGTIG